MRETGILSCRGKRQYPLTLQVCRYCISPLQRRIDWAAWIHTGFNQWIMDGELDVTFDPGIWPSRDAVPALFDVWSTPDTLTWHWGNSGSIYTCTFSQMWLTICSVEYYIQLLVDVNDYIWNSRILSPSVVSFFSMSRLVVGEVCFDIIGRFLRQGVH